MNKVGIILPMYNHSDYINLCLDSIYRARGQSTYRVFVSDDCSEIHESEKVRGLCHFLSQVKQCEFIYSINQKNLGFAGNVNRGLRWALAQPDLTHICILNSDTIVTDYWLDDLVHESTEGLVGPVSNSVGNEQLVRTNYIDHGPSGTTRNLVFQFGIDWRRNHLNNIVETKMLGFFCILGPIGIFKKIGLMDEKFGRGYFEDDDFCHRVISAGYKLKIVRQVFVHHFGSITFKSLGAGVINRLFKVNRDYFIEKHKVHPVDQSNSWKIALCHEIRWLEIQKKPLEPLISEWLTWGISIGNDDQLHMRQKLLTLLLQIIYKRIHNWLLRGVVKAIIFGLIGSDHQKNEFWKQTKRIISKRLFFLGFMRMKPRLKKKSKVIFVFPILSFWGRQQRPQHIPRILAKMGFSIVWIEPDFGHFDRRESHHLKKVESNIYLLVTAGIDYRNFYTSGVSPSEAERLAKILRGIVESNSIPDQNVSVLIQSPFWANVSNLRIFKTIYDCMDFHEGFSTATVEVEMHEKNIIRSASDLVVSTNYLRDFLLSQVSGKQTPIHLIQNGCDPEHFCKVFNSSMKNQVTAKITAGYFGAIAEWFASALIIEVAKKCPDIRFELIGEVTNIEIKSQILPANLILLGEKPYDQLPELTKHWCVGLIPFQLTELIKATNPVKLYEYSAMGLPVVATGIPEVKSCGIKTYCADSVDDMVAKIHEAIREDTDVLRKQRNDFAQLNTWNSRGRDFANLISSGGQI